MQDAYVRYLLLEISFVTYIGKQATLRNKPNI